MLSSLLGMFGSLAGSAGGYAASEISSSKARKWQSAEAQKQREWMEYMSKTAHQREVEDLRAAGLNPILSVTGGSGATVGTPGLPSGTHEYTNYATLGQSVNSAIGVAKDIARLQLEDPVYRAQVKQINKQADLLASQILVEKAKARSLQLDNTAKSLENDINAGLFDSSDSSIPSGRTRPDGSIEVNKLSRPVSRYIISRLQNFSRAQHELYNSSLQPQLTLKDIERTEALIDNLYAGSALSAEEIQHLRRMFRLMERRFEFQNWNDTINTGTGVFEQFIPKKIKHVR